MNDVDMHDNKPEDDKMSRRDAMGYIAGTIAFASVLAGGAEFLLPSEDHSKSEDNHSTSSESHSEHVAEEEHHGPSKTNVATALGVVASLGSVVGGNIAGKQAAALGPNTVLMVGGAEAARLATLSLIGDNKAVEHDLAEIKSGLEIMPGLVLLADALGRTKVDLSVIFKNEYTDAQLEEAKTILEKLPEDQDLNIDKLDPFNENEIFSFEQRLKHQEGRVIDLIQKYTAVGSMVAPILNPNTSSAISDLSQEPIAREIFKLNALRARMLEGSSQFDRGSLEKDALETTEKMMNGPFGYANYIRSVFANGAGEYGAGDFPLFYYYSRHPEKALETNALGFAISEITTIALEQMFLMQVVGPKSLSQIPDLLGKQGIALIGVAKSLVLDADGTMTAGRGIPILKQIAGSKNNNAEELLFNLQDKLVNANLGDDERVEVEKLMNQLSTNLKQGVLIDPISNIEEKIAFLQDGGIQMLRQLDKKVGFDSERLLRLTNLLGSEQDNLDTETLFGYLTSELSNHADEIDGKRISNEILNKAQQEKVNLLSSTLSALVANHKTTDEKIELLTAMFHRIGDGNEKSDKDSLSIIEKFKAGELAGKAIFGQHQEHVEGLVNRIDNKDAITFEETEILFNSLMNIYPGETSIGKSLVRARELIISATETGEEDHHKSFLSHSATEVLYALLTQIPAVPSLVVLAEYFLPKIVGIQDPSHMTVEELGRVTTAMQVTIAGISAFADNIAAYLFGENTLESFYKEFFAQFGVDENNEELKAVLAEVDRVALFNAMTAGLLTLFGNGPNFLQQHLKMDYEDGILNISKEPQVLKNTLVNPTGWLANLGVNVFVRSRLDNAFNALYDKVNQPQTVRKMDRRTFFTRLLGRGEA